MAGAEAKRDPAVAPSAQAERLLVRWRAASASLPNWRELQTLHRETVVVALQDEWSRTSERQRDDIATLIDACGDKHRARPPTDKSRDGGDDKRFAYLKRLVKDAWHHPVLHNIMANKDPKPNEVESWLNEEGCTGALERLRVLSLAGASGEKVALRLALALARVPPARPLLPQLFYKNSLDTLAVLLVRAGRTSDCIAHIKNIDMHTGASLLAKLASRKKSDGRIWKYSRDAALLCAHVLVATCLVKPLEENHLSLLITRLASLYSSQMDELPPVLRKLLHSADTAAHIHSVCRTMQRQFGDSMRSFICELYIRALTTGMNELERHKLQDESVANDASHKLADWFLELAEFLSLNPLLRAECILTAFSLHPSKSYYRYVEECSAVLCKKSPKNQCEEGGISNSDASKNPPGQDLISSNTDESKGCLEVLPQEKSLVSSALLEGESLGLSSDLCHDLVVLLNGPRLKMLTWDLDWSTLSSNCISYMTDTEEGTKTVTTELKYVHLDYSQFDIKEPEIHDMYFGIEKGYEHHLPLADESDEPNDTVYNDYVDIFTDSDENFEVTHKDSKKTKKSSKKHTSGIGTVDKETKINIGSKDSSKKEKKPRSTLKCKNVLKQCDLNDEKSIKIKKESWTPSDDPLCQNLEPKHFGHHATQKLFYNAQNINLISSLSNKKIDRCHQMFDNESTAQKANDVKIDYHDDLCISTTGIKTIDNFEYYIDNKDKIDFACKALYTSLTSPNTGCLNLSKGASTSVAKNVNPLDVKQKSSTSQLMSYRKPDSAKTSIHWTSQTSNDLKLKSPKSTNAKRISNHKKLNIDQMLKQATTVNQSTAHLPYFPISLPPDCTITKVNPNQNQEHSVPPDNGSFNFNTYNFNHLKTAEFNHSTFPKTKTLSKTTSSTNVFSYGKNHQNVYAFEENNLPIEKMSVYKQKCKKSNFTTSFSKGIKHNKKSTSVNVKEQTNHHLLTQNRMKCTAEVNQKNVTTKIMPTPMFIPETFVSNVNIAGFKEYNAPLVDTVSKRPPQPVHDVPHTVHQHYIPVQSDQYPIHESNQHQHTCEKLASNAYQNIQQNIPSSSSIHNLNNELQGIFEDSSGQMHNVMPYTSSKQNIKNDNALLRYLLFGTSDSKVTSQLSVPSSSSDSKDKMSSEELKEKNICNDTATGLSDDEVAKNKEKDKPLVTTQSNDISNKADMKSEYNVSMNDLPKIDESFFDDLYATAGITGIDNNPMSTSSVEKINLLKEVDSSMENNLNIVYEHIVQELQSINDNCNSAYNDTIIFHTQEKDLLRSDHFDILSNEPLKIPSSLTTENSSLNAENINSKQKESVDTSNIIAVEIDDIDINLNEENIKTYILESDQTECNQKPNSSIMDDCKSDMIINSLNRNSDLLKINENKKNDEVDSIIVDMVDLESSLLLKYDSIVKEEITLELPHSMEDHESSFETKTKEESECHMIDKSIIQLLSKESIAIENICINQSIIDDNMEVFSHTDSNNEETLAKYICNNSEDLINDNSNVDTISEDNLAHENKKDYVDGKIILDEVNEVKLDLVPMMSKEDSTNDISSNSQIVSISKVIDGLENGETLICENENKVDAQDLKTLDPPIQSEDSNTGTISVDQICTLKNVDIDISATSILLNDHTTASSNSKIKDCSANILLDPKKLDRSNKNIHKGPFKKICYEKILNQSQPKVLKETISNVMDELNEQEIKPKIIFNTSTTKNSTTGKIVNTEIVNLISDSDNSDVEIVSAQDPIAIDTFKPVLKTIDTECDDNTDLPIARLKVPMLTFIALPNPKKIVNTRNKKKSFKKLPNAREKLYVITEDSARILNILHITPEDKEKLQMVCCVKLERNSTFKMNKRNQKNPSDLIKVNSLNNKESTLSLLKKNRPSLGKKSFKQQRVKYDDNQPLCLLKSQFNCKHNENLKNVLTRSSSKRTEESNLSINESKFECSGVVRHKNNIGKNEQVRMKKGFEIQTVDINKILKSTVNIDTDQSLIEPSPTRNRLKGVKPHSSLEMNETKKINTCAFKFVNNTKNGTLKNASKMTKKMIKSQRTIKSADFLNSENSATIKTEESLPEARLKHDHESNKMVESDLDTTCGDLVDNVVNHVSQPSLPPKISSNDDVKLFESHVDDAVQKCSLRNFSVLKTYQKSCISKKRKSETTSKNIFKKFKRNTAIDLPKTSKRTIGNHKLHITEHQMCDKSIPFSVKRLFLNDSDTEEPKILGSGDDANDVDDLTAIDAKFNISDFLLNKNENQPAESADDPRDNFYSPIFCDFEMDTLENQVDLETQYNQEDELNSEKYLKQGKGFGDRSGRGNSKDSSWGRQEGPAAVLSDTFTTRPPLALHNFTNVKNSDFQILNKEVSDAPKSENELSIPNSITQKLSKLCKSIIKYADKNVSNFEFKDINAKENLITVNELNNNVNILSRVPGLDNLDFMRPPVSTTIVNVVQLGQLPVTSTQQTGLSSNSSPHSTSNSFLDLNSTNATEYGTSSNDNSLQLNTNENVSEYTENEATNTSTARNSTSNENSKTSGNQLPENNIKEKAQESDANFSAIQTSSENTSISAQTLTNITEVFTKTEQSDFQQSTSTFNESVANEIKEEPPETISESPINALPATCTANFVTANRGLVNLLSQKIMHAPINSQHVQMAAFTKGTTINALSLQQALAQILPQSSGESVIHATNHQSGSPQVLHIVQGKNTVQSNAFNSLLVDSSQASVINSSGTTQVLHIVQGKPNSSTSNSSILNQSQISGTTFSGLSLVDATGQQTGNQVLHIVNAGMQTKSNTGAQVLKRVNLLTSITNPQGNSEQKMVQFVCKAPDGKSIQLNAQTPRGMVLRLQPIDGSTFSQTSKTTEAQITTVTTSTASQSSKSQSEQIQQELKSRSVYEENYAKFIQNSSNQTVPSSPEKSTMLPKFNQVFGKSVFQESGNPSKSNESVDQVQTSVLTVSNDQQNSQDVTTVNLGQLGHLSNPPLLIRKAPQTNAVHQNVMQQPKQSLTPMNIQTIHGGVIYTRQIPVNIGGAQTINLITVPSSEMIDEAQLQAIQKQSQEKNNIGDQQIEPQVIKLVTQDQPTPSSSTLAEPNSDDSSQPFSEQSQSTINTHQLLTQMRIKVPMLSKGGGQMVTGTRVVRPVLQIQRNIIPGANPAVYQQLVLTAAPALRQPVPTTTNNVKPVRPPSTPHQESNLSSSTLEQLREFDMVFEQVKERSTVQPGNNSNSAFSESPSQITENNSEIDSSQSSVGQVSQSPSQREVLYSIGPNQTVNVTYVNQKVISKASSGINASFGSSESVANIPPQSSPANPISQGLTNTITHAKPGSSAVTKVNSKSIKTKPSKPLNPSTSNTSKSNPVTPKTSLQKPLEDEQTTQRILYILAEYKEQVENSPDKDKPAPRRRSNPPTNPTTSTKRKKGSSGGTKKSSGQSIQEMSPLGGDDAGHTMGSEDSSCGLSQGECTDNSIQGPENQSPQSSPQKSAKKILFQPEIENTSSPAAQPPPSQQQPQQRNVIITDGQTIAMARPGTGKATAVLMPANYLLPMSMVKGSQQITIVTNQGPKILSVPHAEGGTTNALFVQRLISPAGLKPMLTRPGQVRHVRLPTNAVQNIQAFNISSNANNQETWIQTTPTNTNQQKMIVEYSSNISGSSDQNPDSVKSEISDCPSIKEETISEHLTPKKEDTADQSNDNTHGKSENTLLEQSQTLSENSELQNISENLLQQTLPKSGNTTLNLIQVHSLNSECNKLYSVQNSSTFGSLIQVNKSLSSTIHSPNESETGVMVNDNQNILVRKQYDGQFLNINKTSDKSDLSKISEDTKHLTGESEPQQTFIISSSIQTNEENAICKVQNTDSRAAWSSNGDSAISSNADPSPSFVNFEDSPRQLSLNQDDNTDQENETLRRLSGENTRVLHHPYSPSSSPTGPRHPYHKMFISTPVKKTFNSNMIDQSASPTDEDKQYVQQNLKKNIINSSSVPSVLPHKTNSSFNVHRHTPQVINIRQNDSKTSNTPESEIVGSIPSGRNIGNQNAVTSQSVASLRHKFAVMEHELRLQKSLSEECEDLGVDSPSASDLFPEAELLFATSPSSQFDQSQDGCTLAAISHASPSTLLIPSSGTNSHLISGATITSLQRESRIIESQSLEGSDEIEFARRHPNTTFHSGEIELVGEDASNSSLNITFRTGTSNTITKRNDVVRSVIEGIGNNGGGSSSSSFPLTKNSQHFSLIDLQRRSLNIMSLQSSDDYSEGADDSINSAGSKECLANSKCMENVLSSEIVKQDINLSSVESPICISSGIIQRNVTQVIRHVNSDQLTLSASETNSKLSPSTRPGLNQNGNSLLLENHSDNRPVVDTLTCSSPEQHSELFWESNSNSNHSEEPTVHAPPNLLDFSSEDSNKCCKSPISCEETNSTDSSSLGAINESQKSHHPLRLNSVIKSSSGDTTAAEGPILHNALLSGTPNVVNQDMSKTLSMTMNRIHKSDSNLSSGPEEENSENQKNWSQNFKTSRHTVLSPQSLTTEINIGADIETNSSEGITILTKPIESTIIHSDSSTPEEGSNNRRVSPRAPGGVKRSCPCCSEPESVAPPIASTSAAPRRARRKQQSMTH